MKTRTLDARADLWPILSPRFLARDQVCQLPRGFPQLREAHEMDSWHWKRYFIVRYESFFI